MKNDNGAMIVGAFLAICIITLLIAKIVESVSKFNRQTRYITHELFRADGNAEYRYWRRELRCHYLCLIPFVTERNVLGLYNLIYHKPKHLQKKEHFDVLPHILAPSVLSICICMICLCGISWAWFTASTSTVSTAINSPSYSISYQIGNGEMKEISGETAVYEMEADSCVVTLKALGTTGATGYCGIAVGENTYYTEQITAVGTFSFTVKAPVSTKITLIPKWGSCAVRTDTNKIANGGTVTVAVPEKNTLPADENAIIVPQQDGSMAENALTPPVEEAETEQYETDALAPEPTEQTTVPSETHTPETTQPEETATPAEPVTTPDTTESTIGVPDTTEQAEESTTSASNTGTEDTD